MFNLFDFFFLNLRLLTKCCLDNLENYMKVVNGLHELQNRFSGEESEHEMTKPYKTYLAILLEFKNMCLSDIKCRWFTPCRFEDKVQVRRQDIKVAVITGADKDVGRETATYLAKTGVKVIMGVKDLDEAQRIIAELQVDNTSIEMKALELDLSSLDSVRKFAKQVQKLEPTLDLLINSSELLNDKREVTKDGVERHFAENYLGHFLLTNLLLDNLKKSPNGRVVNVSDMLHHLGSIDFDDLKSEKEYNTYLAFARSKLAQVLFTRELAEHMKETNITTYSLSTNTLRQWKPFPEEDWRKVFNDYCRKISDPVNGMQTILYVALDGQLRDESGYYYNNCERLAYGSNHTDAESAKLWDISCKLVGIENQFPRVVEEESAVVVE